MIDVSCAVIYHLEKVLIAQKSIGLDEGLWEFPGGKCRDTETIEDCVVREIREELGITVVPGKVIFVCSIDTPKYGTINLHFIECRCVETQVVLTEHSETRWVITSELHNYDFTIGDRPFVKWVRAKIK